jgi:hypothetical protein
MKPLKVLLLTIILVVSLCFSKAGNPPFKVVPTLFDQSKPDGLGLVQAKGAETFTVFSPTKSTNHYSNGAVMVGFKGWLYCQWQSSEWDEDSPDTWVVYSRSMDGKNWSEPMKLAVSGKNGYRTSGGWWVNGDTLVAYINVWPSSVSPKGGYTYYATSTDGLSWTDLYPLPMADGNQMAGIFEQDPHALPDGRIIGAAHFQPGTKTSPVYTDDPSGIRGWTRAHFKNLRTANGSSRGIEPSWFLQDDGAIVMPFRDQNGTFRRLASVSIDRGQHWSKPVVTQMPDSRSKQSAGNLPDGTAYMVGNPVQDKNRFPLVITLSRDGRLFDKAFVLRRGGKDLQKKRFNGKAKNPGYNYPKSMVWQGCLYVSYTTNKEDVEYTRVPLSSLIY